ncbi:MAG: hypothetical protein EOP06_27640 [Proteobacteria bacterium]|nr:MAG: hypothetical protein EOP06_27640 [Pseudomonadota bacterium]
MGTKAFIKCVEEANGYGVHTIIYDSSGVSVKCDSRELHSVLEKSDEILNRRYTENSAEVREISQELEISGRFIDGPNLFWKYAADSARPITVADRRANPQPLETSGAYALIGKYVLVGDDVIFVIYDARKI